MDKKKAVELFEQMILTVMKGGGFQDFQTIDQYRQALDCLKKEVQAEGGEAFPLKAVDQ